MRLGKMLLNDWLEKHEEEHRYVKIGTIDGSSFLYCGRYASKMKMIEVSINLFDRMKRSRRVSKKTLMNFVDFGRRKIVTIRKAPISGATIILIEGNETMNLWDETEEVDTKGISVIYSKER